VRHDARLDHLVDRWPVLEREELAEGGDRVECRLARIAAVHQRRDLRAQRHARRARRCTVRVGRPLLRRLRVGEDAALEQVLLALVLAQLNALLVALLSRVLAVNTLLERALAGLADRHVNREG
jgi:hypothetical protein